MQRPGQIRRPVVRVALAHRDVEPLDVPVVAVDEHPALVHRRVDRTCLEHLQTNRALAIAVVPHHIHDQVLADQVRDPGLERRRLDEVQVRVAVGGVVVAARGVREVGQERREEVLQLR